MFHWSDCAVHNAPAYEPGPCDCNGQLVDRGVEIFREWEASMLDKPALDPDAERLVIQLLKLTGAA